MTGRHQKRANNYWTFPFRTMSNFYLYEVLIRGENFGGIFTKKSKKQVLILNCKRTEGISLSKTESRSFKTLKQKKVGQQGLKIETCYPKSSVAIDFLWTRQCFMWCPYNLCYQISLLFLPLTSTSCISHLV